MGLNAASIHLRVGSGPEAHRSVAAAISRVLCDAGYDEAPNGRADRTIILHPASSGSWLTIFDSETPELDHLAADLSRETGREAVCSSIEQSDAMRLALFGPEGFLGALDCQGRKTAGRVEIWTPLLVSAGPEQFREAMERPAIFAEDKLVALAGLLGLNRDLCLAHVDELLDAPGRPVGLRLRFLRQTLAAT
jgi:hypothetical protein